MDRQVQTVYIQNNVLKQSGDSKIVLCIDSTVHGDYQGRLYNHLDKREIAFNGLFDFCYQVENILGRIKFPKPVHKYHSFERNVDLEDKPMCSFPMAGEDSNENLQPGKIATLIVQVQFRQNATWYGLVFPKENVRPLSFKSVLELIRLLDQVVNDLQQETI